MSARGGAWVAALALVACGGGTRGAPKSPAVSGTSEAGSAADATAPPAAAQGGTAASPPERGPAAALDRAERELLVAAADCASACRALGAMDRAAGSLCRVAGASDECTRAVERVRRARRRVADTCGSCSSGPSVDPDGPVPSMP